MREISYSEVISDLVLVGKIELVWYPRKFRMVRIKAE